MQLLSTPEPPVGVPAGSPRRAPQTALGPARSICLIGTAAGVTTLVSTLVPGPDGLDLGAVRVVALATLLLSGLLLLLPWHRLPLSSSLGFVPVALALIGVHNGLAAQDAYRYGVYFLVLFVWIGLWHPRGTSLAVAPAAALAYVLPLVLGAAPAYSPWTVVYALPVYVVVGEVIAWRSARLDAALTELQGQAWTDPLTSLGNRTVLERALAEEGSPFASGALVYLDVDDFKRVNDTLGHAGGDQVLQQVADALRAGVREGDVAVRIAGDEFAVLLAGPLSRVDAVGVVGRLRTALAVVGAAGRPVRTSIGVAWCRGSDSEDVLHRADTAMYRAKAGTAVAAAADEGLVLAAGSPER